MIDEQEILDEALALKQVIHEFVITENLSANAYFLALVGSLCECSMALGVTKDTLLENIGENHDRLNKHQIN